MDQYAPIQLSPVLPVLRKLKPPVWLVRISGGITRVFELYFITVVISFFLGFLNMFAWDDFGQEGFTKFIMGFMYVVLCLVVLIITNKLVKSVIGERSPKMAKNNLVINSLTVILSAGILVAGWFIGTRFLGNDFGVMFIAKWAGGIFSIFVLLLPYRVLKRMETTFNDRYKDVLLNYFLPLSNQKTAWLKQEYLPQEDFINSKIFTFQNIFSYIGSDLFTNEENGLKGSRLVVREKEIKSGGGKTEIEIRELFNGYLFVAGFNKSFNGETFILPDHSRTIFGEVYGEMINERVKRKTSKLVLLEDPEFEKRFAVYSTDEVEARYLLSTKLVERINLFSSEFYQDISISFTENKIYVSIATGKDILSPNLYGRIDDEAYLQKQLKHLHALLTIPEEFDLNTRIWG